MTDSLPGPERVSAFSDAFIAVIIPLWSLSSRHRQSQHSPRCCLSGQPTSYTVSFWFIAVVWINHHHLLHYAQTATPRLIWVNFALLVRPCLLCRSPQMWMADAHLAGVAYPFTPECSGCKFTYFWLDR